MQKQLSAYENDLSEEGRLKTQQLQNQLSEAQENLEESQYDRYINDQKKLLDNLYQEYSDVLNQRLDDTSALIEEMIVQINDNSSNIRDTLSQKADDVGYMLSNSMSDIWETNANDIRSAIEVYGGGVMGGLDNIDTSLEQVISGISETTAKMSDINKTIENAINSVTSGLQKNLSTLGTVSSGSLGSAISQINPSSNTAVGNMTGTGVSSQGSSSPSTGDGFFIHAKDNYPKNLLNINTSIIDRLKYHNYDSSFSARKSYYNSMGFSGVYTGTETQNMQMLNWMKLHGYRNGKFNLKQGELAWTQEGNRPELIMHKDGSMGYPNGTIRTVDGAILTQLSPGDSVFNANATKNIFDFANAPGDFIRNQVKNIPIPSTNMSHDNINNDIQMNITLPNVKNYEQFKYEMQHDPQFERIVQAMTVGRATGGSSLKKYRV